MTRKPNPDDGRSVHVTLTAKGRRLAERLTAGPLDVATWLNASAEGGTLGVLDYLWETFGLFVPGELLLAALGAVFGVSSGPIKRS